MSDSVSAVIRGESAAGVAGLPVVPDTGGEGEHSWADACPDAGDGAAAVSFERELAFAGVDDGLDPLTDAAERAETWCLIAAVGTDEAGGEATGDLLEFLAGEAFVGDEQFLAVEGAVAAHRSSRQAATSRSGSLAGARQKP